MMDEVTKLIAEWKRTQIKDELYLLRLGYLTEVLEVLNDTSTS